MCPLIADGAPGLRSIVWSHRCDGGNRAAVASENTLRCLLYSCGIFVSSSGGILYLGIGGSQSCGYLVGHILVW